MPVDLKDNCKQILCFLIFFLGFTGDSLLQLRATDADTGLNAELKFGWVKGTEQITYKNGSKGR